MDYGLIARGFKHEALTARGSKSSHMHQHPRDAKRLSFIPLFILDCPLFAK